MMFHASTVPVKGPRLSTGLRPLCSTGAREDGGAVVVDGGSVAAELRRRRLGRRGLADKVAASPATTWLPANDDLRTVSSDLLLLAALSLARPTAS